MRAYIDADILIWHLRGQKSAKEFLHEILHNDSYECWTGAMQRAEIVFFMRPEEEDLSLLFLSQFKTAPVDQKTIDLAGTLYRNWHKSHGMDIHDAILAATVMETGGVIFTLNKKHYPMPDISVQKAWETGK